MNTDPPPFLPEPGPPYVTGFIAAPTYEEAYRDGYIDALQHLQLKFGGESESLDNWIEEKLEANE